MYLRFMKERIVVHNISYLYLSYVYLDAIFNYVIVIGINHN